MKNLKEKIQEQFKEAKVHCFSAKAGNLIIEKKGVFVAIRDGAIDTSVYDHESSRVRLQFTFKKALDIRPICEKGGKNESVGIDLDVFFSLRPQDNIQF